MLNVWPFNAKPASPSSEGGDLIAVLRKYSLFHGLSPDKLSKLQPAIMFKEFQDEEIVCHCPHAFHDAFLLLKGVAAVTRQKGILQYVVQLAATGAVFNIGPLVGMGPDQAGVRALGKVQILALDNAMLNRMLDQDPKLGHAITRNVCRLALDQYEHQLDHYLDGDSTISK